MYVLTIDTLDLTFGISSNLRNLHGGTKSNKSLQFYCPQIETKLRRKPEKVKQFIAFFECNFG